MRNPHRLRCRKIQLDQAVAEMSERILNRNPNVEPYLGPAVIFWARPIAACCISPEDRTVVRDGTRWCILKDRFCL